MPPLSCEPVAATAAMTAAADLAPAGSPASRVLRNGLWLAGGQAAATAASAVWLCFVPRVIGPAKMGEIAVATSVAAILGAVVGMGIEQLLTREIARSHSWAMTGIGSGVIIRLLWWLPAVAVVALYNHLSAAGTEQAMLVWLATAAMLLSSVGGVIQAAFTGLERMHYVACSNALSGALSRFAAIGVVMVGSGVVAMLESSLVISALVLALNVLWMRRLFSPAWRPEARELRSLFSRGLPLWAGGLVLTVYLWIDTLMLSALAPAEVVGWYSVPLQIFTTLLMVAGVIGTAWYPRFSIAFTHGAGALRSLARPPVETTILLGLLISAVIAGLSGSLVLTLYGPRFHGAVGPLIVLAISVVPTYFNMLACLVLYASNRSSVWLAVVAVATVLNLGLNAVMIPWTQTHLHNGALGAAVSLLATEVFEAVCALLLMPWLVDARFVRRLARALLAAAGVAGLVTLAGRLGLAGQLVVAIATALLLGALLRIPTQTEVAWLRALASRRLRRPGGRP
jgi:O-antigen/teichoic acid export membrane protein